MQISQHLRQFTRLQKPLPVVGRAAERLLLPQSRQLGQDLGIQSLSKGVVPTSREGMAADFYALDDAFRGLLAGKPTPSAPLNTLFRRYCGGPGSRVVDGERQPSRFTYQHNQLYRGAHPLPATPLSAAHGLTPGAIATSAPGTPGFSAHDYFWMLWEHRATDAVSLVHSPWWPRDQAVYGDITVRRLTDHPVRELPAMDPEELTQLMQPWFGDLWLSTLSNAAACTTTEPLFPSTFLLQKGAESRPIRFNQFTGWPDMGPIHGCTVAALVREIRSRRLQLKPGDPQRGPLVGNCLAGVGRPGTLLCVDALARRAEQQPFHDGYFATLWEVFKLRCQRPTLVGNEIQFMNVLAALPHRTAR